MPPDRPARDRRRRAVLRENRLMESLKAAGDAIATHDEHDASARRPRSSLVAAHAQSPVQPQWKEPHQRSAAAEILTVLMIEGASVALRVLRGRITLGSSRAAAAYALPVHGVAVAGEAKAMAEKAAAQHGSPAYSERGIPACPAALRPMTATTRGG